MAKTPFRIGGGYWLVPAVAAVMLAALFWIFLGGDDEEDPLALEPEAPREAEDPTPMTADPGPVAEEPPVPEPARPEEPSPRLDPPALPPPAPTALEFHQGKRVVKVWRNPRVLLEFNMPRKGVKGPVPPPKPPVEGATLVRTNRFTRIWRLPEGSDSERVAEHLQVTEPGAFSPAFHTAPTEHAHIQGLPGGVIVQFHDRWSRRKVERWAEKHELEAARKLELIGNWYTFETEPGMPSLDTANRLHETGDVQIAQPNWWRDQRPR